MHRIIQERDDKNGPARLSPVVSGPPGLGDPVLLGDVVAVLLSDLAVMRTSAPADRKEKEGRVLRFAPR
jgi:hypothetical protein